jgi:hypothetical protein
MWADPAITRHIGGKPFTEEESWTRISAAALRELASASPAATHNTVR